MILTKKYIHSGFTNDASAIVNAFRERVLADGGTFEAQGYLTEWLKQNRDIYNRSAFLLTPNGYKAGTLYSFKGEDYNTFSRLGTATRIDSQFNQQILANNIPRIDYRFGQPTFVAEPQRTNLAIGSATQTITVVTTNKHSISFFGTGTIVISGGYNQTLVGTSNFIETTSNFNWAFPTTTTVTLTITGNVFWLNFENALGNFQGFHSPTAHIPTVNSTATRVNEVYNNLNLSFLDGKKLFYIDTHLTNNTLNSHVGSYLQMFHSGGTVSVRSDGAVVGGGVFEMGLSTNMFFGIRIRYLLFFDSDNSIVHCVSSFLTNNGVWHIKTSRLNNSIVNPTFTAIRIANNVSMRIKSFAILKDFTGISNVPAYLQELAIKPSI